MMNLITPIINFVVYQAPQNDIVFIFTGIKTPAGDYIQIQVPCPKDEGGKWIYQTFKTMNYETVPDGFEVCAPV